MGRSTTLRIRMAPLALALGANSLLVAWLSMERPGAQARTVAPAMIWMQVVPDDARMPERPEPTTRKVTLRERKRVAVVPPPAPELPPAVEVITAPTTTAGEPAAPSVNWSTAIGDAVRSRLDSEAAAEPGSILDSKPKVMELPKEKEQPRKLGDSEFANGRTIVWVNERCYLESEILRQSEMPRTVCKNRSMADRRSEDRADAIEQAVKQKRSGSGVRP
jgi:hypothetical protein